MKLRRGMGLCDRKISIAVFGAPYYVLHFETLGLLSRKTVSVPLDNILNIQFMEESDYSPAKAGLCAWVASFISHRTAILGAAWGLRKKHAGLIVITAVGGYFNEDIILFAGSPKAAYKKYSRLMQMIGEA
jgi:hypothetical protein